MKNYGTCCHRTRTTTGRLLLYVIVSVNEAPFRPVRLRASPVFGGRPACFFSILMIGGLLLGDAQRSAAQEIPIPPQETPIPSEGTLIPAQETVQGDQARPRLRGTQGAPARLSAAACRHVAPPDHRHQRHVRACELVRGGAHYTEDVVDEHAAGHGVGPG